MRCESRRSRGCIGCMFVRQRNESKEVLRTDESLFESRRRVHKLHATYPYNLRIDHFIFKNMTVDFDSILYILLTREHFIFKLIQSILHIDKSEQLGNETSKEINLNGL